MATTPTWLSELSSGLKGRARHDAPTLQAHAVDYGRMVERRPAVVVNAIDEDDVAHCMRVARAHRIPLAVRGEGHTFAGQSLSDGIVLRLPTGPVELLDDHEFRVSAGALWQNVEASLNDFGRTAPVLTNHLEITVGGTVATGGYGLRSIAQGAQVDHVTRLRVVLPDGAAAWCSRTERADLFAASLGGYGQCGCITQVVMRTLPMAPSLTVAIDAWKSLGALARSLTWTRQDHLVDHFFAYANNDDVVSMQASTAPDALRGRLVPSDAFALRAPSPVDRTTRKHLWSDFGLSWDAFVPFVEMVEQRLQDTWLRIALDRVYIQVLKRPTGQRGLFDIREQPGSGPVFSVGLFFHVAADDAEVLDRVSALITECTEVAGAWGARPYLMGSFAPGTSSLFYPAAMAACQEMRAQVDGPALLNPFAVL